MSIIREPFGRLSSGEKADLYTIKNQAGASISVSTLGAGLVRVCMPDRDGKPGDVVLGYDNPVDYLDADNGYQGLVVGRVANRIAGGRFILDGIEYNVPKNQDNCLCLHGAGRFSFHLWSVEKHTDNSIRLGFFSPDMEDGFPGNFTCFVTYTLTDDNTVRIAYHASADRKTVANLTNHAYFNLACDESSINDHYLMVNADTYLETGEGIIPTGGKKDVAGTPMDFTSLKRIGDTIESEFEDMIAVKGYDHCYCLRNQKGTFAQCARLEERQSGRALEVWTDMPAVQVYAANCLADSMGKYGLKSGYRRGLCLETQLYPDGPNHAEFPSCYIDENDPMDTVTEFRFSTFK